jgi:uncharacterized OsmC-like protein
MILDKKVEVSATYLSDSSFQVSTRGHRLICDSESSEGMSSAELMLASLAASTAQTAAQYLDTRGLPARQVKINVNGDRASHPSRIASIRIDITVPGLNERHQAAIVRSVKTCLIHNTLSLGSAIEVSVNAAASAQVLVARV